MRTARIAGLIAAGALALTVAIPASAADDAMVRVLHASPNTPSVDVFVNDGKVDALSGASFGDLTNYAKVPAGTYSIKVCATADDTLCPIGPVDLTFAAGEKYTIAASDLLDSIKADVFTDGNAVNGKAKVRVVHLSANTPAVDVLTQDGAAKVVEDLSYSNATGYLKLAPGNYDLKVCLNSDNGVCPDAVDLPALDLEGGVAYSVFAIGSLEGGDGIEPLTYVVGVDGLAAPATDTAPTSSSAWLLIVAGLGLLALVASRRLVASRASVK